MSEVLRAFDRQKAAIRRIVAKYRSNPADVEELTQDVFLAGFAAEMRIEIHEPERLLLRIAKNLALNDAAKKVNTASQSIEDSEVSSVLMDEQAVLAEDRLDARQRLYILSQAVAALSPELRRAFVLRKVEGLKFRQIATRLNVSVSTIEKRVAAAMLQCRAYLKERGYHPADFSAASKRAAKTREGVKGAK